MNLIVRLSILLTFCVHFPIATYTDNPKGYRSSPWDCWIVIHLAKAFKHKQLAAWRNAL